MPSNLVQIIIIVVAVIAVVGLLITLIRSRRKGSADNNQIYIGNLAYRVSEHQLRDLFSRFGRIERVRIVKDSRSGRSKGFGFVTFSTTSQAQKALSMHGHDFRGRTIVVRIAKQRQQ